MDPKKNKNYGRFGRSGAKSKCPFKVGDALEYRVTRLLIHLGFFARRGREIYTVGRLDTATDLDVLGIRYAEPFRREVQIVECKGGGEGPMDRIFWLAGVKQYVSADRATLVRHATKWNIKDFAGELGIEILDFPHLAELERAANIDPAVWLGSSDRDYFAANADEWNKALNRDSADKELFLTLAGEIRFHEPFGAISFLLHHMRVLTRRLNERRFDSESLTRFLIAESVAQLAVFLMRIGESCIFLSTEDRKGLIQKGLTYGHMDKVFVDRLFSSAKRITSEMIKHLTGRDVRVDDSYFKMPEPPGVEAVQEMVEMLIARQAAATSFPLLADLLVAERFLKQKDSIDWIAKIFPYVDLKDRLSVVQEYLRVLRSMDAIPGALTGTNKKPTRTETLAPETASESDGDKTVAGGTDVNNSSDASKSRNEGKKEKTIEKSSTLFE